MKRKDWKSSIERAALKVAAEIKLARHQERLKFWQAKETEVMQRIKDDGLEISDSLAGMTYSNAGRGPQVMVRAEYQQDLNECHSKINEHQSKVTEYQGWVEFLGSPGPREVEVEIDDYLFFFGS